MQRSSFETFLKTALLTAHLPEESVMNLLDGEGQRDSLPKPAWDRLRGTIRAARG